MAVSEDIYIGGGPGKHFKQPNPPVKPKWDTEPTETDEPIDAAPRTDLYVAPQLHRSLSVGSEQSAGAPNISNSPLGDFTGMRGIKRKP